MPGNNLGAVFDGEMEGRIEGGVLHLGVNVHAYAQQEDDGLHVLVQHGQVQEVLSSSIYLCRKTDARTQSWLGWVS